MKRMIGKVTMGKQWILFLFLVFLISGALNAQDETLYSEENQLDINKASYKEIAQLPITEALAKRIHNRILYRGPFDHIYQLNQIEGMTTEIFNRIKKLIRVSPFRELSPTQEKIEEIYFRLDRWSSNEGVNDALIDVWIERALDPLNVNTARYDQLINLQNVSPIDAVAIIDYRKETGGIRNARDLRGIPGLSYYGYSNARNFLDYTEAEPETFPVHGHMTVRLHDTPFMAEEAEASQEAGLDLLTSEYVTRFQYRPNLFYKARFSYNRHYKLGFSYTRNLNEPDRYLNDDGLLRIPDGKFFVGVENKEWNDLQLRRLYLGNYSVTFGQGVIMENTDFFLPRKSGYGFRKRFRGINGDNSQTREFSMRGVAAEIAYKNASAIVFGSYDARDAILNRQISDSTLGRSFNHLIVLDQRLDYAPDDSLRNPNNRDLSWLNSVNELAYGAHLQYDFWPGTYLGVSYYESAYDRYLNPDPREIVAKNAGGQNNWDLRQITADSEIKQAYGGPISLGSNPLWGDAVSFRRIYGFDFQTVINNVAIQGEWGELDKGGSVLKMGDDPDALVLSVYTQFPNFNLLALYRNYDLAFDNPYQRSFSNYRRYKGTIFEDYYYLQSALYGQLYANNPQPQAEEGFYINSYYQISRNLIARLEYDNWVRKADNAKQYRLVGIADYRPIWPISIQLRQKWQAREEENDLTLQYFKNMEFRGRFRVRLSNYNNLNLMYMSSKLQVHPRPRVFGDMALDGEAVTGSFEHNFNRNLKLSGMLGYYKGFFWNFEDTQFMVMESTRGAFRYWLSAYMRLNHFLSLRFKYTADMHKPVNNIVFDDVQDWVNEQYPGQKHAADWLRERNDFFYLEMTYSF